jgi:hypothetical protein
MKMGVIIGVLVSPLLLILLLALFRVNRRKTGGRENIII